MNADEVVNTITERVKDTANVQVVFGDPIESGGLTIIPVAKVKIGGGGGGGSGQNRNKGQEAAAAEETGRGMGMGLSITTVPLGYIEIKDGQARFINIVDATKIAVGGIIASCLALLTYSKSMRYKKWMKHKLHHAS